MQSTTINTRTLEIDGMTGDACVQKVAGALNNVPGVTTQSVKVGSATIESDGPGCIRACTAINSAGFTAREGSLNGDAAGCPAAIATPSAEPAAAAAV